MKITDYIKPEAIAALTASDADGVIRELAALAHRTYGITESTNRIVEVLFARERLGSTGLGSGVAIPHAQFPTIPRECVTIGRLADGIDFHAIDGRPVRLFFLLLGPQDVRGHLALLASIARICKKAGFLQQLMEAPGPAEMHELLTSIEV